LAPILQFLECNSQLADLIIADGLPLQELAFNLEQVA